MLSFKPIYKMVLALFKRFSLEPFKDSFKVLWVWPNHSLNSLLIALPIPFLVSMVPNLSPCGFWTVQQTSGACRAPGTVLGAGDAGANRERKPYSWIAVPLGVREDKPSKSSAWKPYRHLKTELPVLQVFISSSCSQFTSETQCRSFHHRDRLSLDAFYFWLMPNWFLIDRFFFFWKIFVVVIKAICTQRCFGSYR